MSKTERSGLDRLPTGPSKRILRPEEVQAWQEGHDFLAAARREHDRMQEASRRAYASEYAQGYDDGKAEGKAEAARLVADTTARVDRYLAGLEDEVATLALDVVRRILGEFETGELVARAARHAVADIRRAKFVKLTVHPDALDHVRGALDAMLADTEAGFAVDVEADHTLAPGACIVATDAAVVDAGIDTQLAAMAAALGGGREGVR